MAILLKVDEAGIAATVQQIQINADKANAFIEAASITLGRGFTDADKQKAFDEGIDFVMAELRSRYPHPGGDDEINLRLMGIDVSEVQELGAQMYLWKTYPQKLVKGRFEVVDIMNLPQVRKHYTYTTNPEQERLYHQATKMADLLNEMLGDVYTSNYGTKVQHVKQGSHMVEMCELMPFLTRQHKGERAGVSRYSDPLRKYAVNLDWIAKFG